MLIDKRHLAGKTRANKGRGRPTVGYFGDIKEWTSRTALTCIPS